MGWSRELLVLSLCALAPGRAAAQNPAIVCGASDATRDQCYRLYEVHQPVTGLMVLLPSYGEGVDFYAFSRLPALLAKQGVMAVVVSLPADLAGYIDDEPLVVLHAMIADVVARYRVPDHRVAIGGLSAGGSGAVRYAEYCALGKCSARTAPVAVASVDAPLDYERFWNSQELSVKRGLPKTPLGESRAILSAMREKLRGSPTEARETYKRFSALLVTEPDGGNAKLLRQTPVRLYTEPDFAWYIDNVNVDGYTMNILDQTAMILQLRVLGNERAELITTTGKGFRADGRRNPHSWSIVDEADLAEWLLRQMGLPAAKE